MIALASLAPLLLAFTIATFPGDYSPDGRSYYAATTQNSEFRRPVRIDRSILSPE